MIGELLTKASVAANDNLPSILVGVGIVGVVGTAVAASKATPKAIELLEKRKSENEDLKTLEKVKTVAKVYAPAVAIGVGTIACFVCSNHINDRRQAALAGLYTAAQSTITLQQDKMKELIGEKKTKEVLEEVEKEKRKAYPVDKSSFPPPGSNSDLFWYDVNGNYFTCDVNTIRKAQNDFNASMLNNPFMPCGSLNDFIDLLPSTVHRIKHAGDMVGWNINVTGPMELDIIWETQDGRPVGNVFHRNPPIKNFNQQN